MADGKPLGWGFAESQALLEPPTDELSELRSYAPRRKQPILLASQQAAIDADAQKFGESEFDELRSYSPLGAKVKAHAKQSASSVAQALTKGLVTDPMKIPAILGSQGARGIVGGLNMLGVTDRDASEVRPPEEALTFNPFGPNFSLYQGASAVDQAVAQAVPAQRGYEDSGFAKVAGGVASLAPALIYGAVGGKGMLFASSAIQNGVGGFEAAKQGGASDLQADEAFWVNALIGGGLDALSVGELAKGFQRLKAAGGVDWAKVARESVRQSGTEGGTEALQQAVADLNARYTYDPQMGWAEIGENALESGAVGAAVGALSGGGSAVTAQYAGGRAQSQPVSPEAASELEELRSAAVPRGTTTADTGAPPGFPGTAQAPAQGIDLTGRDPRSIAEQEAALQGAPPLSPEETQKRDALRAQLHAEGLARQEERVAAVARQETGPSEAELAGEVERQERERREYEAELALATDPAEIERLQSMGTPLSREIARMRETAAQPDPAKAPDVPASPPDPNAGPTVNWLEVGNEVDRLELAGVSREEATARVREMAKRGEFPSQRPKTTAPAAAPLKPEPISGTAAQTPFAPTGEGGAAAASLQSPQAAGRDPEEDAYFAKFQADTGVAVKRVRPTGDPNITELEERAAQSGARLVWFDPEGGRVPAGAHMKKGLIFLDATQPAQARRYVFNHELWHELKQRFPDVAQRVTNVMREADPQAFEQRLSDYLKSFEGSPIKVRQEMLEEESAANTVQDFGGFLDAAMRTPEKLQAAIEADPGLWRSIADAMLKILRRIGVYKGKTFAHRARLKALSEFAQTPYERGGIKPNVAAQLALEIKQAFDLLTEEEAGPSEAAKAQQPGEFAEPARYAAPSKKTDELGFFSQLERTIEQKLPARASAKQVMDVAKGGAKAEELEYSGLAQFLEGKGSVKKEDVLAFLRENNVTVQEVTKGQTPSALSQEERNRFVELGNVVDQTETERSEYRALRERMQRDDSGDDTKFQNYQLPGGENYRELLLTLPKAEPRIENFSEWAERNRPDWDTAKIDAEFKRREESPEYRDWNAKSGPDANLAFERGQFSGGHFDEPNVLAHVRFNERTDSEGRRVLFLEEVQSDWHQKGRKQGYKSAATDKRIAELGTELEGIYKSKEFKDSDYPRSDDLDRKVHALIQERDRLSFGQIPDAPFKTSWHELALKRMLRYAADQGFDSIAWTTGEQQAERYDLSKYVESIRYKKQAGDTYTISAKPLSGGEPLMRELPAAQLPDMIGKDAADRVLRDEGDEIGQGFRELKGDNLKVGGEGMKGFYDQILVRYANKLAKRWGGRVEKATVKTDNAPDDVVARYADQPEHPFTKRQRATVHSLVIPDAMRADVRVEGFPRFAAMPAVSGTGEKQGFDVPDESALELFERKVRDRFNRWRVTQEAVAKQGGALSESENIYQAETVFPGRSAERVEALGRKVDRLAKILKQGGVSLQDAGRYVYARHAPRRNALIAERHPKKYGSESSPGSGMRTSEAQALVQAAESGPQAQTFKRVAAWSDQITAQVRDAMEQGGLLSSEERAAWEEKFGPEYVPLLTVLDDPLVEHRPGAGRGFKVTGKESKRAEGRATEAFNPLVSLVSRAQEAYLRIERNRVGQRAGTLVKNRPAPDQWKHVDSPDWKAAKEGRVFSYKDAGVEQHIEFADAKLAKALAGVGLEDVGKVMRVLSSAMRIYGGLRTTYDPEFLTSNLFRDVETASVHMGIEQGRKFGSSVRKGIRKSIRAGFQVMQSPDAKGPYQDAFREFRSEGGMTGFISPKSIQELATSVEKRIAQADAKGPKATLRALNDWWTNLGRAVENGVRLSFYVEAKKAGMSKEKAAAGAQELTIRFSRKGEWGPVINAAYLFGNANIQGSARMLKLVAKNRTAQKVAVGLFAAGFLESWLNSMLADDDEDGENHWEKRPAHEKARNLFLEIPGSDGKAVKVPMFYGWNVFTFAGIAAHHTISGAWSPGQAVSEFGSVALEAFNPIGGGSLLQTALPTVLDPIAQVAENKTFSGAPMRPENYGRPDSQTAFPSTPEHYKDLAEWMNRVTGGSTVREGAADVSPETLEYTWTEIVGGPGKLASRGMETVRDIASGERPALNEIPIVRRFLGEADERYLGRRFREVGEELETRAREVKIGERKSLTSKEESALDDYKAAKKEVASLLEELDETKSDATKKRLEREIRRVQERLVKAAR